MNKTKPVKLTVRLPRSVAEALKAISDSRGVSMTEIIRRAISKEKFIHDVRGNGHRLLLEKPSGEVMEIL